MKFQSPMDGSEMLLTPEMSMALQNQVRALRQRRVIAFSCMAAVSVHVCQIGSDIMMALDDVVDSKSVDAARCV